MSFSGWDREDEPDGDEKPQFLLTTIAVWLGFIAPVASGAYAGAVDCCPPKLASCAKQ